MPSGNPNDSLYSEPAESPGMLLMRASNRWRAQQRRALEPFGLSRAQFVLLALLGWLEDQDVITQRRLADEAALDVMSTSTALRALEREGLIERHMHPDDGRARSLHTTKPGRQMILRAVPAIEQCDEDFFAAVSDCREELLSLLAELAY